MSPLPISMSNSSNRSINKSDLRRIDNSSVVGMISVKGEQVKDEHSEHAYTYTAADNENMNDALIIRAKRTRVPTPRRLPF